MPQVRIEMIIDENDAFHDKVDLEIAQLMMLSDFITVNSNTVRVYAKEVTSAGIVKFYGIRKKPEDIR
ncbi:MULTISPECIES: hypothetical protein [Bacillaceae]|uniref:Uncharacterized protein n=1 Tax=Metabacillus sediminis TaxID=3117746 RepID=A0ABZ2NN18_9BACI|nr:hypothetical protein [Bacillus sp. SJS]KZZ82735.1 hypothetical protein AS29_018180 [Bacillus sp. SJS]